MMEQKHGGDLYGRESLLDFSANLNPLGMPEAVRVAAIEGVNQSMRYPDPHQRDLKAALSQHLGAQEQWLLCGNGAAELIFAICAGLKPKKALLIAPGFAEYEAALTAQQTELVFYSCTREHGFALTEDYLNFLTDDVDLAFLCNPSNPTGLLIPEALMSRIAARCRRKQIHLVVDECFLPLTLSPEQTLVPSLTEGDVVMVLQAFTKLYAMPGLRLGYLVCPEKSAYDAISMHLQPWNVSLPAQMAGAAALEEIGYAAKTAAYVAKERTVMMEELRNLGLVCCEGTANYIFFQGPKGLYDACLQEGVLIRDCSNYRGLSEEYYRVAVRTVQENRILLQALQRILGKR